MMSGFWDRFKNNPAIIGALILAVINLLIARGVFVMSVDEVGWLNVILSLVFGAGVRQLAYGPMTGSQMETELDTLKGEFLDQ